MHTLTSSALTGLVATTLRATAEELKGLFVDPRALESVFLSMLPLQTKATTTRGDKERWR